MTTCYNAIDRLDYVEGNSLHYGPGASIGVVGFLCNLITFFLILANIYWGSGSSSSSSTASPMSYLTYLYAYTMLSYACINGHIVHHSTSHEHDIDGV